MRPRLVLDTNVLISGLLFGGTPRVLLQLVLEGAVELITSSLLLDELEGVLRDKFPQHLQAIRDTLRALTDLATLTIPHERVSAILEDPSDNRVLECAISAQAHVIISGDRHLLALKAFRGVPILSPHAFLAHWRSKKS